MKLTTVSSRFLGGLSLIGQGLVLLLLSTIVVQGEEIAIDDSDGALGATHAPVAMSVKLSPGEQRAAAEGRLQLRELQPTAPAVESAVPVQLLASAEADGSARLCWLMPPGPKGKRTFALEEMPQATAPVLIAQLDAASGHYDITDAGKPVLRYNYATNEPGDVMNQVAEPSRMYVHARGDYLHPIFGLDGEILTQDWALDHPHHRGIYWAWPEVDWRGQRGDLHALQHVFARPTGNCTVKSGPVFAQLVAENVWKWEGGEALVQEQAVIRAYRATGDHRIIDLELQFTALNDPVLLARRGTRNYGGLNLRTAGVKDQEIVDHTDPAESASRLAWAELSAKFSDAPQTSGLVVLQHCSNPGYPGDWVRFPELNWFQPTFPTSGTRHELKQGEPLLLRYRLWLHRGAKASEESCAAHCRSFHASFTPTILPIH